MASVRKFKAESQKVLNLMVNSIYTNKDIFLRELISNASDAIDKYHYLSLVDEKVPHQDEYEIRIEIDKEKRQITISDTGIGMTFDEINNNLGTIAKSGSEEFKSKLKEAEQTHDVDIIGQFGVGFYSSFIVAEQVEVLTKSPYSDKGYLFKSKGQETYTVDEVKLEKPGTKIILTLKESTDENDYDRYLQEWTIRNLVKKYSDYIRYPIKMEVTKSLPKYDEDGKVIEGEYEEKVVDETLNSMVPIWKKRSNEVSDEELNEFYKNKFMDYEDPLTSFLFSAEGLVSYNALIYIPKRVPYNLYSLDYEKGLQLYTKGIFIMDKCKELVPDYLRFVKGLVDTSDLSLNISREMLQQNHQLLKIASNVEKKIISNLEKMLKNERDKYIEFFDSYGVNLKFGAYDNFGEKKDLLKDLILYRTLNEENYITLKEYVEKMKEGQEFIYYASGKTKEAVMALPQLDLVKKQGYDVLILTDDVDEFLITILSEYDGKKFKSINQGDLGLLSKEEEEKFDSLKEEKKPILEKLKEYLKEEVDDVILSKRLSESPVCLVSGEGLSFEMEKVIERMPNNEKVKAKRILEINPKHELFKAIEKVYQSDDTELSDYAHLLYNQALLIEGLPIKDPVDFSNKMVNLMIKSAK
ncbi:TPA: molecular chaperone HtpG [bacterium]|nr:molecular chaperone HtpG [bacterium]